MGRRIYILPLDTVFDHIFACRREQSRPTPFVHGVLHERPHGRYSNLGWHPVGFNGLFLLIYVTAPGCTALIHGPVALGLWNPGSLLCMRRTMARTIKI